MIESLQLGKVIRLIRKPLVFTVLFALLFFLILFPTGDLGDLVSSKVSESTNNQVFLQFGDFSFGVFPPALDFEGVFIETPFAPGMSADEVKISPNLSSVFSKKPYGSIDIDGIFKGALTISLKKGTATETGVERHRALLEINKINLASVKETFKISLIPEGLLTLNLDGQGDLEASEQPEADLNVEIEKFVLPPASVNTPIGPLLLPDFKLALFQLKGRLSNGKINIESGSIGKKQDELFGTVKGFLSMSLINIGGRITPQWGAYNLEINLLMSKAFEEKAKFLSLIDQFKSSTPEGTRYHFKVIGTDFNNFPNFSNP